MLHGASQGTLKRTKYSMHLASDFTSKTSLEEHQAPESGGKV